MLCLQAGYFACTGLLLEKHVFSRKTFILFFFPQLATSCIWLFMVLFSSSTLHAAASDRDYFKASYNGLLIYLAKMRKLAPHWPLVSWWQLLLWIWLPSPSWNPWLSKYLNLPKLIMKLRSLSERDVQATEGGGFFFFSQYWSQVHFLMMNQSKWIPSAHHRGLSKRGLGFSQCKLQIF